ncbi:Hypothetical predicted protein [Podarcis lilfordi]|uniref:Uncharacterized protein n=1 Tax=Podarcis lilfordi TaxID=74358 RepID=A0AA35KEV9_9SAUR|nr:Hypothetical predicted protein [Podarcis lilfordi]
MPRRALLQPVLQSVFCSAGKAFSNCQVLCSQQAPAYRLLRILLQKSLGPASPTGLPGCCLSHQAIPFIYPCQIS